MSILFLRRQWTQDDLLKGVEKALEWGSVDYAAVDQIIRQNQISTSIDNQDQDLISTQEAWSFDLSPYAELCMEGS